MGKSRGTRLGAIAGNSKPGTGAAFTCEAIVLPSDDAFPLFLTANRYSRPEFAQYGWDHDPDAITLIMLHSTSFHKETWEPTISRLFDLLVKSKQVKVREAFALDCPNHGAAVDYNEDVLRTHPKYHEFTCEKYAESVHRFLTLSNLTDRNLVGIGHSLGSVSMSFLQHTEPRIAFRSLILVEPIMSPQGAHLLQPLRRALVKSAYERRDVWPSREDALEKLQQGQRTKTWHPEIYKLFVTHAIRKHPGAKHADTPYNGVTLACTREQEANMYRDTDGPTKPVQYLTETCAKIPVHIVFGERDDFVPRMVQTEIINPVSGRNFASIAFIDGAGHLVPQQVPQKLAPIIFKNLVQTHGGRKPSAKL